MADYNKLLQVPRGTKARLEEIKLDLLVNTIVYATDTKELGIKLSNGNIEYFKNATDIDATLDTLETSKQDKLVAGDNITIDPTTNVISASGVDQDAMAYFNYASSIYGDKYNLLANAWEHSLTVDPSEIERVSTTSTQYGKLQYPNGEDNGVIIPDSVTSIGDWAFGDWRLNEQPLVIPNSVTSIGGYAFSYWYANNQPLVIPNSVTSIGNGAFYNWLSNSHPLVIPNSVTGIGNSAFNGWSNVPYVEIQATTPPTLASANAFGSQNDAPIYVPDESVDDYKTATNWVELAGRIFPISDRPDEVDDKIIAHNTNSEAHQDIRGDIQTIEQSINGLENNKVDKVSGKGLSTNDYTNTDKQSVEKIPTIEQDILDLESDKVDKVSGKGLSTEDYTSAEKTKLSGIEAGAQVNKVNSVNGYVDDVELNAGHIPFNGILTYYLTDKFSTETAIKGLDSRAKTNADNIALKEDSANKVDNLNTPNNTTFGTTLAVKTYVDAMVFQKHDIVLIDDTAFTITQAHFNKTLIITSSSDVTITVPTKIVESIEKGFFCDIVRYGTGEVTFSGTGIVLNSAGPLSIDGQYIAVSLIKIDDNNEWLLIGGRE